jgi:hypothetical protein
MLFQYTRNRAYATETNHTWAGIKYAGTITTLLQYMTCRTIYFITVINENRTWSGSRIPSIHPSIHPELLSRTVESRVLSAHAPLCGLSTALPGMEPISTPAFPASRRRLMRTELESSGIALPELHDDLGIQL